MNEISVFGLESEKRHFSVVYGLLVVRNRFFVFPTSLSTAGFPRRGVQSISPKSLPH